MIQFSLGLGWLLGVWGELGEEGRVEELGEGLGWWVGCGGVVGGGVVGFEEVKGLAEVTLFDL